MIIKVKDVVVGVKEHGLDIARHSSSSNSRVSVLSLSASPKIYIKKELELNEPYLVYVPEYGVKQVKLTGVSTLDVEVKITTVPYPFTYRHFKDVDNSKATPSEKASFIRYVNQFYQDVVDSCKNKERDEVKQALIDLKELVSYLVVSANTIGKKDLLLLSVSLLGGFSVNGLYAPDVAAEIITGVLSSAPSFFNSIGHLIPEVANALVRVNDNS